VMGPGQLQLSYQASPRFSESRGADYGSSTMRNDPHSPLPRCIVGPIHLANQGNRQEVPYPWVLHRMPSPGLATGLAYRHCLLHSLVHCVPDPTCRHYRPTPIVRTLWVAHVVNGFVVVGNGPHLLSLLCLPNCIHKINTDITKRKLVPIQALIVTSMTSQR